MVKLFGKKLNIEEMFVGAFIQAPFYFVIGWWVLILMGISAILWALGGAEKSNKAFRRLGVPVATSLSIVVSNASLWPYLAFILAGFGVVSIGYGMPDQADKGSILGRFYFNTLKLEYSVATFATRVTTYTLYWLSFILVGIAVSRI